LERRGYRSHEFGDSVLLVSRARRNRHPYLGLRAADSCCTPGAVERELGRGLVQALSTLEHRSVTGNRSPPLATLWVGPDAPPYKSSSVSAFPIVRGTFFEAK
jgi:hypothetical protein